MGLRKLTAEDLRYAAGMVRDVETAIAEEFQTPKAINPLKGNQTFRARVRDCCILLQLADGTDEEDDV